MSQKKTWDDTFPNIRAATDIIPAEKGCLPGFPCPENLPYGTMTSTLDVSNLYNKTSKKEILAAYESSPSRDTTSEKALTMIALARLGVKMGSDQSRLQQTFQELGLKKNQWQQWFELKERVQNEIGVQENVKKQLKQMFERRSNLKSTVRVEERQQMINPVWEEVKFLQGMTQNNESVENFIEKQLMEFKDAVSGNKNAEFVSSAIELCNTTDTIDIAKQFLSWQYIDFNEIPCGSLMDWSHYTTFRVKNLVKKNRREEREFKTIRQEEQNPETGLLRSLFMIPLAPIYDFLDLDEILLDSPIERFNALTVNPSVQWYAESENPNKPQGMKLTSFSQIDEYLHYCAVLMGRGDRAGFFGWIQMLYFLGYDVVESLRDVCEQVLHKMKVYVEDHEEEKETMRTYQAYIQGIIARLDDFFLFWVNRMRTQYGLSPPPGKEQDPNWEMGFRQFQHAEIMKGGDRGNNKMRTMGYVPNQDKKKNQNQRGEKKNKDKKKEKHVSVVAGIAGYVVCHDAIKGEFWKKEPLSATVLSSVKDTKSGFSGITREVLMPRGVASVPSLMTAITIPAGSVVGSVVNGSIFETSYKNLLSGIRGTLPKDTKNVNDVITKQSGVTDGLTYSVLKAGVESGLTTLGNIFDEAKKSQNQTLANQAEVLAQRLADYVSDLNTRVKDAVYTTPAQKNAYFPTDALKTNLITLLGEISNLAGSSGVNATNVNTQKGKVSQGVLVGGKKKDKKKGNRSQGENKSGNREGEKGDKLKYLFMNVSKEVEDSVRDIFWLRAYKTSYRADEKDFARASYEWWSGQTRDLADGAFYLGGAGVRIEGETSFDCGTAFVRFANLYALAQKKNVRVLMEELSRGALIMIPETAASGRYTVQRAYAFLLAAVKEAAVRTMYESRGQAVPQRNRVLYEANLVAAFQEMWGVQRGNGANNKTREGAFKLFESQVGSLLRGAGGSVAELIGGVQKSISEYVSREVPSVNSVSGNGVSGAVSGPAVSTTAEGFKIISEAAESVIVSQDYWNTLVQKAGKNFYVPMTLEDGRAMSRDYVLSWLEIGVNATQIVREGRGIQWNRMKQFIYPVRSAGEFSERMMDGQVIIADEPASKASSRGWRRTSLPHMKKYLVTRMRIINQNADRPAEVMTVANFRRVWFEIMVNNVLYNIFTRVPWDARNSPLKTRLVRMCQSQTGSDMTACPLVYTRLQVSRFMGSRGKPLPGGFDWLSGMMTFRAKRTEAERITYMRAKNKKGLNVV